MTHVSGRYAELSSCLNYINIKEIIVNAVGKVNVTAMWQQNSDIKYNGCL